ncbi:MAG: carboxylesterase/lipase family protein [Iamia sp.]
MTTTEPGRTVDVTVTTAHGPVEGRRQGGAAVFKGIPYGAATTGARRLSPPQEPAPWTDPLDCSTTAIAAPQNPSLLETALGSEGLVFDEDCLRVNVFSPDTDASLPVMVWLHGGGFETGTPSMGWYDGVRLSERGVVVVTVGYRLGVLGHLQVPGAPGSGCFGLLDQIAALRWVRDNVAAFGGDPGQVTLFGESAGAMSIGTLLTAPGAQGLFHRAILQSGSTHNVHSPEVADRIAARFGEESGVDSSDLDALRALTVDEVLAAQARIGREGDASFGLPWQPVLGSEEVPERPLEAVRAGRSAAVDLLVGTTLEEMKLFPLITPSLADVDDPALVARARAYEGLMGREPGSLLASYAARTGELPPSDRFLALVTDLVFRIPAIRLAEAQAARGAAVRMYLFAEASDAFGGALGCCHAMDLPFSWDNLDAPGTEILFEELTDARRRLARRMGDAWTAFARGADDPAPDDAGAWPTYDEERRATLWMAADRFEVVDDPFGGEREWWDGLDAGFADGLALR